MPEKRIDSRASGSREMLDDAKRILGEHLSRLGLKHSAQRETILRVFLATHDHLSTEELHGLVKRHDPAIGYTTVYRTLKLFTQCGLATAVEFHDGIARYEQCLNRRNHHHMVCTVCGDSVEFFSPEVEAVERSIAKKFHYTATRHNFQIYGTCDACREKLRKAPVQKRKTRLP